MRQSLDANTEHLRALTERVRALFTAAEAADAFSFSDSPLLQSWSGCMEVDDIDAANPDEVALHARWDSEDQVFEQKVTIGNLVEALNLMKGETFSQLEFHDENGHCKLSLFSLTPYPGNLPAADLSAASGGDQRGLNGSLRRR